MKRRIYMIDGVAVSKQVWERRQIWGEHPGARFHVQDIPVKEDYGRR